MNTALIILASLSIGATFGLFAGGLIRHAKERAHEPYRRIDPGRS